MVSDVLIISQSMSTKNNEWTGKLGFILSLAGAAVGLGNIWRFPYLVAEGGGMFVLFYALCMFFLVLPIMFFEIKMGQMTRQNPIDSFITICKKYKVNKLFALNAYVGLLIVFSTLSFYTVVSGWVIYYLIDAVLSPPVADFVEARIQWMNLLDSPNNMIRFNVIFLAANALVLIRGVKKGLEFLNRIMMPGLFVILLFMLVFAAFSDEMNVLQATLLFTDLRLDQFNTGVFLQALGQALFTLAVGACAILTYGAYLPKSEGKILFSANAIIVSQLVISLMLGVVIYSLITADKGSYLVEPGPELIFVALPVFFAKTAIPKLLTILFFLITFFASITSSINIAEPMVYILNDKFKLKRHLACIIVLAAVALTSTILTLSFASSIDLFGFLVQMVTEFLMPVAALVFSIFAGWFLDKTFLREMLAFDKEGSSKMHLFYHFARYSMRFLFPLAILVVMLI